MITLNFNINIPTKISEVRDIIKRRIDKKYRHNKSLFDSITKDICDELKSGYWNNDISDFMKKELTSYPYGKVYEIIRKYKSKLK